MITREVSYGQTPNGGSVSEIYYLDSQGKPIDKSKAKIAVIRELDKKGNLVFETRGTIS